MDIAEAEVDVVRVIGSIQTGREVVVTLRIIPRIIVILLEVGLHRRRRRVGFCLWCRQVFIQIIAHDLPGTVRLPASRTVSLLFPPADDDGGDEFATRLTLVVIIGGDGHDHPRAPGVGIDPVRSLVARIVFQGILEGIVHGLLFRRIQAVIRLRQAAGCTGQDDSQNRQYGNHPFHFRSPRRQRNLPAAPPDILLHGRLGVGPLVQAGCFSDCLSCLYFRFFDGYPTQRVYRILDKIPSGAKRARLTKLAVFQPKALIACINSARVSFRWRGLPNPSSSRWYRSKRASFAALPLRTPMMP